MSQKLLKNKNPFQNAESFVKKIRTQVYGLPNPKKQQTSLNKQISTPTYEYIKTQNNNTSTKLKQPSSHQASSIFSQFTYTPEQLNNYVYKHSQQPIKIKQVQKPNTRKDCQRVDYTFQNNFLSQHQEDKKIDSHLDQFLKESCNFKMVMEMVGVRNQPDKLIDSKQQHQGMSSQFKNINKQEDEKQQPLDFDALREEQLVEQNQLSNFISELKIPNQILNTHSKVPVLVCDQINTQFILDMKFNCQLQINKRSFRNVTRKFLTSQQVIETKKYILKQ